MSAYFSFFRQVLWLTMWSLLFVVNGGQVVAQSSPLYASRISTRLCACRTAIACEPCER